MMKRFIFLSILSILTNQSNATDLIEEYQGGIPLLKENPRIQSLRQGDALQDIYESSIVRVYPKTFNDSENSKDIKNLIVLGKKGVNFLEIDRISKNIYISNKENGKIELDKLLVRGFNWSVDSEKMEKYIQNASFTLRNLGNNEYTLDVSHSLLGGGALFSKTSEPDEYYEGFILASTLTEEDWEQNLNNEVYRQRISNLDSIQKIYFEVGFTKGLKEAKIYKKIEDIDKFVQKIKSKYIKSLLKKVVCDWSQQDQDNESNQENILNDLLKPQTQEEILVDIGGEVGEFVASNISQDSKEIGKQCGQIIAKSSLNLVNSEIQKRGKK